MLSIKVKKWFEEAIRLDIEAPSDLKDTLLRGGPKIEQFINSMAVELDKACSTCLAKGIVIKEKTMQDYVYDMVKYFMKGLESEARKRYESDLAKAARDAQASKLAEFEKASNGIIDGEFAEAGLITNAKLDQEREKSL